MSNYWTELNKFEDKSVSYGLIPDGTIAKVKLSIKPGGYNDQEQGWLDNYATKSIISGSVFLDVEYVITAGKYAKRKIWGLIGLHSSNGPEWSNMGKAFIKSIINSAKGILPKDNSEAAINARKIESFKALDGIEFVARIDEVKDHQGNNKNEIKVAITPDHKDYLSIMGRVSYVSPQAIAANTTKAANTANNFSNSSWSHGGVYAQRS